MTIKVIISDWATQAHSSPADANDYRHMKPPTHNIHYDWCVENATPDAWRMIFKYPYYDIILTDEDASAFFLKFGTDIYHARI